MTRRALAFAISIFCGLASNALAQDDCLNLQALAKQISNIGDQDTQIGLTDASPQAGDKTVVSPEFSAQAALHVASSAGIVDDHTPADRGFVMFTRGTTFAHNGVFFPLKSYSFSQSGCSIVTVSDHFDHAATYRMTPGIEEYSKNIQSLGGTTVKTETLDRVESVPALPVRMIVEYQEQPLDPTDTGGKTGIVNYAVAVTNPAAETFSVAHVCTGVEMTETHVLTTTETLGWTNKGDLYIGVPTIATDVLSEAIGMNAELEQDGGQSYYCSQLGPQ